MREQCVSEATRNSSQKIRFMIHNRYILANMKMPNEELSEENRQITSRGPTVFSREFFPMLKIKQHRSQPAWRPGGGSSRPNI